ncbi:hypothetical protein IFR05_006189 [Cadophora sp. M221]|nr:hypothetical protein IFR05_006189 [Cadophora sp. M221]
MSYRQSSNTPLPSNVLDRLLDFRPTYSRFPTGQTWHLSPRWTWDSRGGPKGQVHSSPAEFQAAGGREYVDLAFPTKQKILGEGAYGEVVRVSCNGRYLARKKTSIDPKYQKDMLDNVDEINILKQLSHQHIAQLCGVYVLGTDLYSLSYPVAEMDLVRYMRQCKIHDPTWVQSLIGGLGCLSRALAYAHSAGIKHKDIHAGNILVIGGTMILCDWGLSSRSTASSSRFTTRFDIRARDIQRLGSVFQLMILVTQTDMKNISTARLPTTGLKSKDILSRIMTGGRKRLEYADLGDLVKIMTTDDEKMRPTARQVADYLRLGEFAWAWRGGMPDGEGDVVCTTCGSCCV